MRELRPWHLVAAWVLGALTFAPTLNIGLPDISWLLPVGVHSPISEPGFRVLIVEETEDRSRLSQGQIDAMLSTKNGSCKAYVESKGGVLRPLDQNDDPAMLDAPWAKLLARPRKSLPWLEVANPPRGFEGPLPETEAETLAILKKVGG